jgi:plastocyanin
MSIARTGRSVLVMATVVALLAMATPAAAVQVVRGEGTRWSPASVSVSRGEAVRWRAVARGHVVKSLGSNWSYRRTIRQGESVRRVFDARGTFRFYCTIHGSLDGTRCVGMCGKVAVAS